MNDLISFFFPHTVISSSYSQYLYFADKEFEARGEIAQVGSGGSYGLASAISCGLELNYLMSESS